jgi:hypothetical protein
MSDFSKIGANFERFLRHVSHSEPITTKYREFELYLAQVLGMPASDIYTAHILRPGNFDVRMTQSERARTAQLRVGLVPHETDNEWNVAYLKGVASRIARDRNPGTAVLLFFDGPGGWTPRWAIVPAGPEPPSTPPSSLSQFGTWFDEFELATYPHTTPNFPLASAHESEEASRREVVTERVEQMLHVMSARPEITEMLYRLDPSLFTRLIEGDVTARDVVAIAHRRAVVDRFRRLLEEAEFFSDAAEPFDGRKEAVWQNLLEENPWILGVSLAGQLLTSWNDKKLEQVVAGFSISGPGKRSDALMRTNGRIRAMVFAEIKHHETELIGAEYRSGCWAPSPHLAGGVVQVQQTVHLAVRQIDGRLSERDESGAEIGEHTYMVRPRSFLILGSLEQLRGPSGVHREKYESFELYRRNLYEPEILTFDELLARAEWHVERLDENMNRRE